MTVLWLIVVVLKPGAPDPSVFRDLCEREGGELRIETGLIRMGTRIYQEGTWRGGMPAVEKKADPPKRVTGGIKGLNPKVMNCKGFWVDVVLFLPFFLFPCDYVSQLTILM